MNKILLARYRALTVKALEYILTRGNILAKLYSSAGARDSQTTEGSGIGNFKDSSVANSIAQYVDDLYLWIIDELRSNARGNVAVALNSKALSATTLKTISSAITHGIVWGRGSINMVFEHLASIIAAEAEHGGGSSHTTDRVIASLSMSGVRYASGNSKTGHLYFARGRETDAINSLGIVLSELLTNSNPSIEDFEMVLMTTICYISAVSNITTMSPEDLLMMTYSKYMSYANHTTQEPENIYARSLVEMLSTAGGFVVSYMIDTRGLLSAYFTAIASMRDSTALERSGTSKTSLLINSGARVISSESQDFVDGVLYLRSTYEIVQNGSVIDLSTPSAKQEGNVLHISSTYDAVHENDILEFRALPIVQDGEVLRISSLYDAAQSDTILEVN